MMSGSNDGFRNHIRRILQRKSPFGDNQTITDPSHDFSDDIIDFLFNQCKILVVGAGGLGCEVLKDLALMGVRDIHVIDMDTIELSNLNRQFLFRTHDIGRPKAEVAAEYVRRLVPDCKVTHHYNNINDFDWRFYNVFNIIICGLDSIEARRFINKTVVSMVRYDDEGNLDQSSVIPLIDGGTEGLKGNARVILPGMTACIECNLDLYPPPVNFPICTLANHPRLPEHTIEWVKVTLWPREQPFGQNVSIDSDIPEHIEWIHKRAVERAREFSVEEPTIKFTKDVVKRTIPAVSSTNASIAATCVMEAFKLITSCAKPMNNFQILNLNSGIYTYVFEAEKNPDCLVCGPPKIEVKPPK